jgi:hypothetical protein
LRTLIRLCILCLFLTSCRDEFSFSTPPIPVHQFSITSELTPFDIVRLEINENILIGERLSDFDRRDATIVFRGGDVPNGEIPMAFNSTSNKYHLVNEDFRVSEGVNYSAFIILPDSEEVPISARTTIPESVGFDTEIISHRRIPVDGLRSNHEVELMIHLDEPIQRPTFYRFVPFRLKSTVRRGNNGSTDFIDTPEKILMEVSEVKSNANSVFFFQQRDGLHIEESRLNSSTLHLVLRTIEPIMDGEDIPLSQGRDIIRRLRLELLTLNQELFEYDRQVNALILNQGANIPVQSLNAANIENATGVFAGFGRTIATPSLPQ